MKEDTHQETHGELCNLSDEFSSLEGESQMSGGGCGVGRGWTVGGNEYQDTQFGCCYLSAPSPISEMNSSSSASRFE